MPTAHDRLMVIRVLKFLINAYNHFKAINQYNTNNFRWWVRPIFERKKREEVVEMKLVAELRNDAEAFHPYFRMDVASFDWLMGQTKPIIEKQDTPFCFSISADTRLALTIR